MLLSENGSNERFLIRINDAIKRNIDFEQYGLDLIKNKAEKTSKNECRNQYCETPFRDSPLFNRITGRAETTEW